MEEKKKIRIVYTILFVLAALVALYYQHAYEKVDASWYGINIYFWAVVIGIPAAIGMNYLNFLIAEHFDRAFDYKRFIPGPYMYAFLMAGCMLSVYLGIRFTEPSEEWSTSHTEVAHNDRYYHSPFYQWYYYSSFNDVGDGIDTGSSSSSDDKSGEAIAYLILILIVVLILILSATVKHFWVVGSIIVLIMMGQYLYRAWTQTEEDDPSARYRRRW